MAHEENIELIGLTICPRAINHEYTTAKNELRKKINTWILNEAAFDKSIDVAKMVANADDTALDCKYDCGDGIHINELAGKEIAEVLSEYFKNRQVGFKFET